MGPIQSNPPRRRPAQVHVEYQPAAHGGWEAVSVSEFTQLALWMAGTLAGMVTAALTARTPFFRGVMRRLGIAADATASRGHRAPARPTLDQSLPMLAEDLRQLRLDGVLLRRLLLARHRTDLAAEVLAHRAEHAYWHADTWYYPLPRTALAMAIEFQGDAQRVELLRRRKPDRR
jgi:hypothetical protein